MNIWVIMIIVMVLSYIIQLTLNSKFDKYSRIPGPHGLTGADVARLMLRQNGINDVTVQSVAGKLTDLYMFCTQDFADKYNEGYLLTHGGINYNNQYAQDCVEGSNGRLHIIPMYNKIGSKFIHICPKSNMLIGYDQMGDMESVMVKEYEPFILSYIATMFFGCQFESINKRRFKAIELGA